MKEKWKEQVQEKFLCIMQYVAEEGAGVNHYFAYFLRKGYENDTRIDSDGWVRSLKGLPLSSQLMLLSNSFPAFVIPNDDVCELSSPYIID